LYKDGYTISDMNNTTTTTSKSKKFNSTVATTVIEATEIRGFKFSKVLHDVRVQRYDGAHRDAGSVEEYFWASNGIDQIMMISKAEHAQLIAGA
jgi:hypothetical protein